MQWIVLKQEKDGSKRTFGPITAGSAEQAIRDLCEGRGENRDSLARQVGLVSRAYIATGRGRYHALPLSVWQDGTFDYTKTRGAERVEF